MKKPEIVQVPIGQLKPSDYNPRKWSKEAIADLKASMERFGFVEPIIVNSAPKRKNVVIGGHFRLHIAKMLKHTEVPVVYLNIPLEENERELNLRLNKNTGEWDFSALANFDVDMLLEIGFSSEETDEIFHINIDENESEGAGGKEIECPSCGHMFNPKKK